MCAFVFLQRLIYGLDLIKHILLPGYTLALILTYFSTEEYICVAWDSAGVTTGPITVPLVSDKSTSLPVAFGMASPTQQIGHLYTNFMGGGSADSMQH